MKYCFTNCTIYTGGEVLNDRAIIVDENKIESIVNTSEIPENIEVIDLKGLNVAPGFIDLQVNGGGGCLFNDSPTPENILKIFKTHKRFGVTSFLPTIITTHMGKIYKAIENVQHCMMDNKYGVVGLHVEGPFINITRAGIHDKDHIRSIMTKELEYFAQKGKEIVKLITLAPELLDQEHINILNENGIEVSAGHSNATYQGAMECFSHGVSMVTHLFNAMSQFKNREPGLVGAALDSDAWTSIIADGIHVDYASVRIAKKIKKDKLILISDAMPPVGSEIDEFLIKDMKILCKGGKCFSEEGTLAGASLDMATAVRNCIKEVGIQPDEALRMASTYPAKVIGMDKTLGKIEPEYIANMVVFDNDISVKGTVLHGEYEEY